MIEDCIVNVTGGEMSESEKLAYKIDCLRRHGMTPREMDIEIDGDFVNIRYHFRAPNFSRIRRITGYLTGDLDTWNDAKRAEERDRVKHGAKS